MSIGILLSTSSKNIIRTHHSNSGSIVTRTLVGKNYETSYQKCLSFGRWRRFEAWMGKNLKPPSRGEMLDMLCRGVPIYTVQNSHLLTAHSCHPHVPVQGSKQTCVTISIRRPFNNVKYVEKVLINWLTMGKIKNCARPDFVLPRPVVVANCFTVNSRKECLSCANWDSKESTWLPQYGRVSSGKKTRCTKKKNEHASKTTVDPRVMQQEQISVGRKKH